MDLPALHGTPALEIVPDRGQVEYQVNTVPLRWAMRTN